MIEDSAPIFDQPARSVGFTAGGFQTLEGSSLGSIPRSTEKADLGSIPRKAAKSLISASKAGKLPVAKSRGRAESWTVAIDRQTAFRIRLTESGYAVVLRWTEENGRRPEKYCCYLSRSEWAAAKRKDLRAFAALVAEKIEPGKVDLILRVRAFV